MKNFSKRLAFDFDGVINSYISGWTGIDHLVDPPISGIKELFESLKIKGYEIYIFSSRCTEEKGIIAITEYLIKYNIPFDAVIEGKPDKCWLIIDDRCICFKGKPHIKTLLQEIEDFKPYDYNINKKG